MNAGEDLITNRAGESSLIDMEDIGIELARSTRVTDFSCSLPLLSESVPAGFDGGDLEGAGSRVPFSAADNLFALS